MANVREILMNLRPIVIPTRVEPPRSAGDVPQACHRPLATLANHGAQIEWRENQPISSILIA